jgi:hypothetical protein
LASREVPHLRAERSGSPERLSTMTASRPLYLLAAASAAAGLLAACSSPHAPASSPGTSSPGAPATRPALGPAIGLVPAPGGLTDSLVLQRTQVTAGTPIRATLIVTYRGRAPINLTHECRPQYAVVVTNHRFPPAVAFTSDCKLLPFIIKPGENRLAATVETTYLNCSEVAGQATRRSPACLPGRPTMPPLPAGRYEAVLVGEGLPLPAPAPVPVILAAAR